MKGSDLMPAVGIGVIIFNKEGKVLLLLRNDDAKKADSLMRLEGTWTFPAGKVKYGETIFDAAIRKVKQEANLEIENPKIVSISDDINSFAHFVTFGLMVKDYEGNISLGNSEEHVDYDFFDINELPENLCMPSRNIVNNYKNNILYKGADYNEQ